jgi:tetratricopeptide (TPR) repeat protein
MRVPAAVVAILIIGQTIWASAQRAILADVTTVQVEPTVIANPDKVKEESAATLMMDSLINALRNANLEVGESSVRAHIVLEEFTSGSTAKRFLVGMGAGRSTVDGRLIFNDATGRELANIDIRVRGNLLFSPYQGDGTQRRQATNAFDKKLAEEIAKLRPAGSSAARPAAASSAAKPAPPPASAPPAPPAAPSAIAPAAPASPPPVAAPAPPAAAPVAPTRSQPVIVPDPAAARTSLEAGTRAETAKDWKTALQHYQRARALDPSMSAFIDASIARVKEQMGTPSDSDALRRARQYDALGRRAEAITWYERALESLPESDPNREIVRKRLNELMGAQ